MAASNRAARLTKLVTDLKKRYKPAAPAQRPLFETILFATLLENSPPDAASKVFDEIESSYFDWNEVRVSSRSELAERMKPLTDPLESADRFKRTLQAIFETVYAFDLEVMKKQNLGQAVKTIEGFDGVTPFVVNYATQNGLSGHAIACNQGVLIALQVMDIITEAEAKKSTVPGLERAIPKSKGVEAQLVLHEMGVEIGKNPYGPAAKKLLTELDPSCKDRLPKKPKPPEPAPEEPAPVEKPAAKGAAAKPAGEKKAAPAEKETSDKKPVAAKPASSKTDASAKPAAADKKPAESKPEKKPEKKPSAPEKKAVAKKASPTKTPAKKTPPQKPTTKKPATKKTPTKKPAAAPSAAKKKPATKAKPNTSAKKVADKKPAKRKPK